jgi:RHS repeat-associated protein
MITTNNLGTPGAPTTIMTYGYDNVGNVTSMTDSINGNIGVNNARQYDALNRLTVNSQGNKRVDYGYNALGQVTNKKRFSDTTGTNLVAETNHTYDQIDRLTGITHSKGATNIATYTQTYDANSRITGITNKDGTAAYNYDNTDQLTGADFSFQTDENYSYDNNGNRTNSGYVTGTNNRLLEDPKYRYDYDLVGNRTKRTDKATSEVTEYAWDIRDRLTGITVKNAGGAVIKSASYKYDVYDQRISKTVDLDGAGVLAATTERYVYGSNQNIALEFDGNGSLTHRYLFADGIDQIEADESNGSVLWGLVDHLGSVRDVVDNSGTVRNHISYDSFGNITAQTDSSVVFRYGYTGREFDKESGLYYYRSRPYDPTTGRFIQEDKIGFRGGDLNLSRYVRNSPVGAIDPTGQYGRVTKFNREIEAYGSGSIIPDPTLSKLSTNRPRKTVNDLSTIDNTPVRISKDIVTATIVKDTSQSSNPSTNVHEPIGGRLTFGNTKDFAPKRRSYAREEARGHIIPNELGGSNEQNVVPFAENFISKNPGVNSGSYKTFGSKVNTILDALYKQYESERQGHQKRKCLTDIPKKPPYVEITVVLEHDDPLISSSSPESFYPFRPSNLNASAIFYRPGSYLYTSGSRSISLLAGSYPNKLAKTGGGGITYNNTGF